MDSLNLIGSPMRSPHEYFKDALELFKNDQFDDALQLLDAAIIFSHNSPFYIYQKIRLLYHLGDSEKCNIFILSQLEHLFKHGSLYILCRSIDYLQKVSCYTINELRTLLDEHSVPYCLADSYAIWLTQKEKPFYNLAKKALSQDYYELCLCYCMLYLKLHPSDAKICYIQGYCYHMLGNLILAKTYYEQYISLEPNNTDGHVHIGLISMGLGDYDTALNHLQLANSLNPNNPEYSLYLGECYYAAKKYQEAACTYKNIITTESSHLQSCFNLSHTYKKTSQNRLSKRHTRHIKKY